MDILSSLQAKMSKLSMAKDSLDMSGRTGSSKGTTKQAGPSFDSPVTDLSDSARGYPDGAMDDSTYSSRHRSKDDPRNTQTSRDSPPPPSPAPRPQADSWSARTKLSKEELIAQYTGPTSSVAESKSCEEAGVQANTEDNTEKDVFQKIIELAARGREELVLSKLPKPAPPQKTLEATADIVFLLDATESMTDVIAQVKDKIVDIVNRAKDSSSSWNFRVGFVAYRDVGITPACEFCPLTFDTAYFMKKLGDLKVITDTKQRDEPEDVVLGLLMTTFQPWEAAARTVIHIADAPCHGVKYHGEKYQTGKKKLPDRFEDGFARKGDPTPAELLQELRYTHEVTQYLFVHLKRKMTGNMIKQFREEIKDPEGDWLLENDLSEVDGGLISAVVGAVNSSIRLRLAEKQAGPSKK